jgi:hypothetical protein
VYRQTPLHLLHVLLELPLEPRNLVQGSGFRVQGSGCRVQGTGFGPHDLPHLRLLEARNLLHARLLQARNLFRVYGLGFMVQGLGFRVQARNLLDALGFRVQGSGFRV